MTTQDKITVTVFTTFVLLTIGLVVYNALTLGTECTFCIR
jgi:hypothetical protein